MLLDDPGVAEDGHQEGDDQEGRSHEAGGDPAQVALIWKSVIGKSNFNLSKPHRLNFFEDVAANCICEIPCCLILDGLELNTN